MTRMPATHVPRRNAHSRLLNDAFSPARTKYVPTMDETMPPAAMSIGSTMNGEKRLSNKGMSPVVLAAKAAMAMAAMMEPT